MGTHQLHFKYRVRQWIKSFEHYLKLLILFLWILLIVAYVKALFTLSLGWQGPTSATLRSHNDGNWNKCIPVWGTGKIKFF